MRTPTEAELNRLVHAVYDPVQAHKYYEEHKHLKGRQSKGAPQAGPLHTSGAHKDPGTGKNQVAVAQNSKAKQKQQLTQLIHNLEGKLRKLEALIRKKEHEAASENRKSKANKERARKASEKPKTAAEKAKAARESEKYRKAHRQELANKSKQASSSSKGGTTSKSKSKAASVSGLKALATRVRGEIAMAKIKLAAL